MTQTASSRTGAWRAALAAPAAWAAGLAAAGAALAAAAVTGWSEAAIAAAACALPALVTAAALRAARREWAQLIAITSWTVLAMAAVGAAGLVSGAAAWFVAPPIAALAFPRRALVSEAAGMSLAGLAAMSALQIAGAAPPPIDWAATLQASIAAAALAVLFAAAGLLGAAARRSADETDAAYRADTLEGLLTGAQVGLIKSDAEGRIEFASPAAINFFGARRFERHGPVLRDLPRQPDDRSALTAAIDRLSHSGLPETLEIEGRGERRAELRLTRLDGGLSVSLIDVTQRAELERRAYLERDAARASNDAKSRFLAGMTHEIRTPLNAVIGFSDVMKQRMFGPLPAKYAEYADLIHESGRHLLDLVGDVLDMSKIEAERYELRREEFDARDIASSTVKLMQLRAEEAGIALSHQPSHAPLTVSADRKAMRQILLNLLSNAVKFTPEGGAVWVSVESEGGDLVMTVRDTGAGMNEAEIARIGHPYQQADSALGSEERGSGLGLSLVAALVSLHDGEFEIESARGRGTTARVRLPVLISGTRQEPPERFDARARLKKAQEAGERLKRATAEASSG